MVISRRKPDAAFNALGSGSGHRRLGVLTLIAGLVVASRMSETLKRKEAPP